jgi:hypothetical protein
MLKCLVPDLLLEMRRTPTLIALLRVLYGITDEADYTDLLFQSLTAAYCCYQWNLQR